MAGILAWSDAKFREFVKRIGWHSVTLQDPKVTLPARNDRNDRLFRLK